jgi:hypothetical protein
MWTLSDWASLVAVILSVAVALVGLIKSKAETFKIGGETFTSYQAALGKAQENYDSLVKSTDVRFDKLQVQYDSLETKYNKVLVHNRCLVDQLIANKLVPVTMEQAIKISKGE